MSLQKFRQNVKDKQTEYRQDYALTAMAINTSTKLSVQTHPKTRNMPDTQSLIHPLNIPMRKTIKAKPNVYSTHLCSAVIHPALSPCIHPTDLLQSLPAMSESWTRESFFGVGSFRGINWHGSLNCLNILSMNRTMNNSLSVSFIYCSRLIQQQCYK